MQAAYAADDGIRPQRLHELTCDLNRPRVVVVAVVMASFLISAFIAIGPTRVAYVKAHPACKSAECTALAQAISSSVNTRIAPCQNFYRFVCDGWVKTHPARDGELRRLVLRELADEVASAQKKALISTQVQCVKRAVVHYEPRLHHIARVSKRSSMYCAKAAMEKRKIQRSVGI